MKGHRQQVTVYSFLLFFLLSTVYCTLYPTFAADSIGKSRISPASPLYFLKSVREILELKFADNLDIKSKFRLEFATRRIREVRSLVGTPGEDLIEPALTRYASHLQELASIANFRDKDLKAEVAEVTTEHMKILQEIYGTVSEQRAKRSIRVAIYKLSERDNILTDKVSACNFLSKEASNSAIVETERWVLSQRAQKCSLRTAP